VDAETQDDGDHHHCNLEAGRERVCVREEGGNVYSLTWITANAIPIDPNTSWYLSRKSTTPSRQP
jgi:hypothetical protein